MLEYSLNGQTGMIPNYLGTSGLNAEVPKFIASSTSGSLLLILNLVFVQSQLPWQDNEYHRPKNARFLQSDGPFQTHQTQADIYLDWTPDGAASRRGSPTFFRPQAWLGNSNDQPYFTNPTQNPGFGNDPADRPWNNDRNGVRLRPGNLVTTAAPDARIKAHAARAPDNLVNNRFTSIQYGGNYENTAPRQYVFARSRSNTFKPSPAMPAGFLTQITNEQAVGQTIIQTVTTTTKSAIPTVTSQVTTTIASTLPVTLNTVTPSNEPDTVTSNLKTTTSSSKKRRKRTTSTIAYDDDDDSVVSSTSFTSTSTRANPKICESLITVSKTDFTRMEASGIFSQLKSGTCIQVVGN